MNEEYLIKTAKRQDAAMAPQMEQNLKAAVESGAACVVLDMTDTVYISSVTIRMVLKAHKQLLAGGRSLVIRHAKETVMEVFDLVGLTGILNFEEEE